MARRITKAQFSLVHRAMSFVHAGRGLWLFVKTTPNAWIHLLAFLGVLSGGFYFSITTTEWILLVLTSGMVLSAEAFNSALEIDIDLTSPTYHPYARDTKDIAAGAVLITTIAAAVVGILIFAPYVIKAVY
jgi:diacylglycerol kinase (ATP)